MLALTKEKLPTPLMGSSIVVVEIGLFTDLCVSRVDFEGELFGPCRDQVLVRANTIITFEEVIEHESFYDPKSEWNIRSLDDLGLGIECLIRAFEIRYLSDIQRLAQANDLARYCQVVGLNAKDVAEGLFVNASSLVAIWTGSGEVRN